MGLKYRSRRSVKRLARKSKRNFIITLVFIGILIYSTLTWVLPSFIGGVCFVQNIIHPPKKINVQIPENSNLAPPVLNIPYEATNTARIDINGFATPGSKVKLYLDDNSKLTTDVSGDGSFIFQNVDLSLGTNNINGKTLDDNSKESLSSKTIKLIYDNQKPPLSINEPEDGKKIQGGNKKIKVSGKTEPGAKVFINGAQVIVNSDGNFNFEHPLNDGNNDIVIQAIDTAANITEFQKLINYSPQETQ